MHTTNLISGLMFIVLGVVFIAYEGTSALSGFYEENGAVDIAFAAERWVGSFSRVVSEYLLVAVLAVTVVVLALVRAGAHFRKRDGAFERGSRDGEETSR